MKANIELDPVDQEIAGPIIIEADERGLESLRM